MMMQCSHSPICKLVFPNGVVPHPMLSIHVRHGDKYKEMQLLPLQDFIAAAEKYDVFSKVQRVHECIQEAVTPFAVWGSGYFHFH